MKTDPQFDWRLPAFAVVGFIGISINKFYVTLNLAELILYSFAAIVLLAVAIVFCWDRYSKGGRKRRACLDHIREIPRSLLTPSLESVRMGEDLDLNSAQIYLPDSIRSRHVHILGATGSGKTESVILNFLRQDVRRDLGSIILDAKGDLSFLNSLIEWVPFNRLKVFDLGTAKSLIYNPLEVGTPLEAAQRLHSSLTWSEEYYKSKAFSALQKMFQRHFEMNSRNPTLSDLSIYLDCPEKFIAIVMSEIYPKELAAKDFMELSGLRDQINSLTTGHLGKLLSPPNGKSEMQLEGVADGQVLYFRLQSLMSPQIVSTLGKLLINHLSFIAGTAHKEDQQANGGKITPIYLDEFASFACPEFADLISKARSAKMALHFSHQSIGDLADLPEGYLNRITDNSATKIVLRINDPDSAEFFARSFGTKIYQKVTQRITNAKNIDSAEVLEEGTTREAHQFRAGPDLFKSHATGVGSVLIAHGIETPHGASTVFKIKFPKLKGEL